MHWLPPGGRWPSLKCDLAPAPRATHTNNTFDLKNGILSFTTQQVVKIRKGWTRKKLYLFDRIFFGQTLINEYVRNHRRQKKVLIFMQRQIRLCNDDVAENVYS